MNANIPSKEPAVIPPETTIKTNHEKNTLALHDGDFSETTTTEADLEKQVPKSCNPPPDQKSSGEDSEYPPWRETILIMLALYLVMFLMALVSALVAFALPVQWILIFVQDRTIIGTAIC